MKRTAVLLASAAALVGSPAFAQAGQIVPTETPGATRPDQPAEADQGVGANAQAQAAAQDSGQLEDIVVTAQKREQRLRDVPVAVTALTADTLIARGINDVAAVTRAVPSLTVTQTDVATSNSINIRGIGTNAFSIGVEPAVAVVLDDVALLQQAQAFSGLSDIARIEVLRGPQGTLFGKGASAGVVNIASQAPSSKLEAGVATQLTTDQEFRLDGSISGPVTDWLGVRANFFVVDRDGYINNRAGGDRLGGEKSNGVRIRVDIDPTSRLNIALIASTSRNVTEPVRTFRYIQSANTRIFAVQPYFAGNLLAPGLVGIVPGTGNYETRVNVRPKSDSEQSLYIGRATLDLGFANLISVTGYQTWDLATREDTDLTDLASIAGNAGGVSQISDYNARQFSQELRLVSSGGGPFSYVGGLYYANGHTDRSFQRFAFGPGAQQWTGRAGTESYAAFGQATLNITGTTHVDGGIRFNRETIDVRFTDLRSSATAATCGTGCAGDSSDDQITYKAALRQDLNRSTMVYASYATGYKGQGYDVSSGFTPTRASTPIRPEHSKAYEVGLKGQFFDNHVQLNLAGFWTDYKDFQTQTAANVGGVLTFLLANAPRLRSRGIEGDVSIRPFRALRLDGGASYTDARIQEFSTATCYPGEPFVVGTVATTPGVCVGATTSTGVQNLAGARLANAPKFKYTVSGTYDVTLPSLPFDGFVQADWSYQSSVNFDIGGNPLTFQRGYGVLNGSIGLKADDGRGYQISLFANNLLDKHYATQITAASGSNTDAGVTNTGLATAQFLSRDSRRYFGIRARVRY
ncbi:TonB-dependent receptor [Sphingomonas kyungheensis]|uniref:TonB-dependent receptor n=1 Tax=Sphingomonas kyungheensis TaxID=1069987 RepID=A0ABU8H6G4_9SPHN